MIYGIEVQYTVGILLIMCIVYLIGINIYYWIAERLNIKNDKANRNDTRENGYKKNTQEKPAPDK